MMKEKKKLIVLYEEDKNNPKGTWSGASYPLRESLRDYFEIVFIDSCDSVFLKQLKRISKAIEKKNVSVFFRPLYEKLHQLEIMNRIKQYKNIPVLEICENVVLKNDFYLYRDIAYACYPYVLEKFNNNNNDYGHGMLNHLSKKSLKSKIKNEEKLEKQAKKTFFTVNWVTNMMKDKYPSISNKFEYTGIGFNGEFLIDDEQYEKKKNQILFVGIDFLRKGGDLVVEAIKLLRKKYNIDANLLIAGVDGNGKNEEGIHFLGKKSRKELTKLFKESTIFCMPSRFDCGGNVFIEAHCFGLPIVARDDFEMKYYVCDKKDGYLVKSDDIEELADTIYMALTNRDMQKYVESKKEEYRIQYSWDKVAKKIYESIMNNEENKSN